MTHEQVLIVNLPPQEPRGIALRQTLNRLGIEWIDAGDSDVGRTLASLFGDVSATECHDSIPQSAASSETAGSVVPSGPAETAALGTLIVFNGLGDERLQEVLSVLRRPDVGPFPLKAVLTDQNRRWTLAELRNELAVEHRFMTAFSRLRRSLAAANALPPETRWASLAQAVADAEALLAQPQPPAPEVLDDAAKRMEQALNGGSSALRTPDPA